MKNITEKLKQLLSALASVKPATWVRVLIFLLTTANLVLTELGKPPLPFSDTQVGQLASWIAFGLSSLWAAWKNNSFTPAAQFADLLLQHARDNDVNIENCGLTYQNTNDESLQYTVNIKEEQNG
ncbi:MAG: SPP1 phage holin family protein [Oscillospiraceae bacterium]|jgi:SPP1 family holin|nr:SPP1 phage holin family protein [Oscillospiraceae bacterium]